MEHDLTMLSAVDFERLKAAVLDEGFRRDLAECEQAVALFRAIQPEPARMFPHRFSGIVSCN